MALTSLGLIETQIMNWTSPEWSFPLCPPKGHNTGCSGLVWWLNHPSCWGFCQAVTAADWPLGLQGKVSQKWEEFSQAWPVLLGEVPAKRAFGFLVRRAVRGERSGTEHWDGEDFGSGFDALEVSSLSCAHSHALPLHIHGGNSTAPEGIIPALGLSGSLELSAAVAANKIRCTWAEIIRASPYPGEELWCSGRSCGARESRQKLRIFKVPETPASVIPPSVLVTNQLALASFPKASKSRQWNYSRFMTPLRLEFSRHCFIVCFTLSVLGWLLGSSYDFSQVLAV